MQHRPLIPNAQFSVEVLVKMHRLTKIDRFSFHLCMHFVFFVLIGLSGHLNSKIHEKQ